MLVDAPINKHEPPTNMSGLFLNDTLTHFYTSIVSYFLLSAPRKSKIVTRIPVSRAHISLLTPRQPVSSTFKPNQLCLFTFVSSFSPSNKAVSLCKHPSGREIHPKQIMTDKHNLPLSQFNLFMPSNLFLRPHKPWYELLNFPQRSTTQHATLMQK